MKCTIFQTCRVQTEQKCLIFLWHMWNGADHQCAIFQVRSYRWSSTSLHLRKYTLIKWPGCSTIRCSNDVSVHQNEAIEQLRLECMYISCYSELLLVMKRIIWVLFRYICNIVFQQATFCYIVWSRSTLVKLWYQYYHICA
jgi:hypothetical protein